MDAGVRFGMQMLAVAEGRPPGAGDPHDGRADRLQGALWGTFGTEYARGFIEEQLRGMEPDVPHERFWNPRAMKTPQR